MKAVMKRPPTRTSKSKQNHRRKSQGRWVEVSEDAEIVALISYLQRLGRDIKIEKTAGIETSN
jgi:cbb3-type cytochrome oxidase cytochrome c subunit